MPLKDDPGENKEQRREGKEREVKKSQLDRIQKERVRSSTREDIPYLSPRKSRVVGRERSATIDVSPRAIGGKEKSKSRKAERITSRNETPPPYTPRGSRRIRKEEMDNLKSPRKKKLEEKPKSSENPPPYLTSPEQRDPVAPRKPILGILGTLRKTRSKDHLFRNESSPETPSPNGMEEESLVEKLKREQEIIKIRLKEAKRYEKEKLKNEKEETKRKAREEKRRKKEGDDDLVPILVRECISYLEKRGLHSEGILRVSGSVVQIKLLKRCYDKGQYKKVHLDQLADPHTVAGLLKTYFRDLSEPLLTYSMYNAWIATADLNGEERILQISKLVEELPLANKETLDCLLGFLVKVEANSDINKMNVTNISTMFGPNLLRSKEESVQRMLDDGPHISAVVQTLILEYFSIFKKTPPAELEQRSAEHVTVEHVKGQMFRSLIRQQLEVAKANGQIESESPDTPRRRAKKTNGQIESESPDTPRRREKKIKKEKKETRPKSEKKEKKEKKKTDSPKAKRIVIGEDGSIELPADEKQEKRERKIKLDDGSKTPQGEGEGDRKGPFHLDLQRVRSLTRDNPSPRPSSNSESEDNESRVSPFIAKVIHFLEENALSQKGLFSNLIERKLVREACSQGDKIDCDSFPIDVLAEALKVTVGALEPPLLTLDDDAFGDFLSATGFSFNRNSQAAISETSSRSWFLRELVEESLDKTNIATLRMLMQLLWRVHSSEETEVDSEELGGIFAPLLLQQTDSQVASTLATLIRDSPVIWTEQNV